MTLIKLSIQVFNSFIITFTFVSVSVNACILFENFENHILEDKFIFIMSNEGIPPLFFAKTI